MKDDKDSDNNKKINTKNSKAIKNFRAIVFCCGIFFSPKCQ